MTIIFYILNKFWISPFLWSPN